MIQNRRSPDYSTEKQFIMLSDVLVLVFCALLFFLLGCGKEGSHPPVSAPELTLGNSGASASATALFGYSFVDDDKVFTQHINENGLGYELMSGNWANGYYNLTGFKTSKKNLLIGQRGDNHWFVQEFAPTGDLGRETDHGKWDNYYDTLVGYQCYGKSLIFLHTTKDGNYWEIQDVNEDGTLPGGIKSNGRFRHYYEKIVPMEFGGPTFLFGQTHKSFWEHDYGDRHWFIQRVHSDGTMGAETDSGDWNHFYGNTVFFKAGDRHYIFGQSSDNKHWFIQHVTEEGKMGAETDSGTWEHYYDTSTIFYVGGKAYLFAHGWAENDEDEDKNRWFISELKEGGKMGDEIDHGYWDKGYTLLYPFAFDWSYRNVSNWMGQMKDILDDRKLKNVCLPGSHDSGMSYTHTCHFGNDCNTRTQKFDIAGQLENGARYFDLRPLFDTPSGDWYFAHADLNAGTLYGCYGESVDNALYNVKHFFEKPENKDELVILKFSHCFDKERLLGQSRECAYWHVRELEDLIEYYLEPLMVKCDNCDLRQMTLKQIKALGNVIVIETTANSGPEDGFFTSSDVAIYDNYSNTNDFSTMQDDQVDKLLNEDTKTKDNHYGQLFLFSWTLTLSGTQASNCTVKPSSTSIMDMARTAGPKLVPELIQLVEKDQMTQYLFPNILYVDNFDAFATRAAMYVNKMRNDLKD